MNILMLVYPNMTQLDFMGPLEIFSRVSGFNIQKVWKHTKPIMVSGGLSIRADKTFNDCFQADVMLILN